MGLTAELDPNLIARCWVQTYTGKAVHLLDPKPEEIDIVDIAHSLAHQFRYNGHTLKPITVAEHCILVSHFVAPGNALWGLLHDAAEFAVGDLVGPLKRMLPEFSRIEAGVMRCICEKFGLFPQDEPAEVKNIDRRLLHNELADLMAAPPQNWALTGEAVPGVTFNCWKPKLAEVMFLARFEELTALPSSRLL